MFVKSLLMSGLCLVSSFAFGQATYENTPTGVFTQIVAEPANGGINPDYVGVRLHGTVKAGHNPCEGSSYKFSLKKKSTAWGAVVFEPKLKQDSAKICTKHLDLTYAGIAFDVTVIVKKAELESTFVNHVGRANNLVSLEFLVNANAPIVDEPTPEETEEEAPRVCEERVMCTMEYRPTTCTYGDLTFSGNNPCQARGAAEYHLCSLGQALVPAELKCSTGELM